MSSPNLLEPLPAGAAPQEPPRSQVPGRLQKIFRSSLREGKIHPLLHLMQAYRVQRGLSPVSPPSAPAAPAAATLPRTIAPEHVRARVTELPPLPQAAVRALGTLRRDDSSLEEVAADLSCDPSLTARVLRLANSPFYGVSGRISTLSSAAQVLGRRTLESVLTLAAVAGQFGKHGSKTFDSSAFWRHALGSAIVARSLARAAGCDEDQAFVAGLLHDIGLLAMSSYFPAELDELIACAGASDMPLSAIERKLGLTPHAQIGAWLAAHWRFPAEVVTAIAAHHAEVPEAGPRASVADCVHVANAIAHALELAQLEGELVPPVEPGAWRRVSVSDDIFMRIFEEAESGVTALCGALSL